MTRAERAARKAYGKSISKDLLSGRDLVHLSNLFRAYKKEFTKGYQQAEKETIERAVAWLCTHHPFDTAEQAQLYAAAFRKAMEKEE